MRWLGGGRHCGRRRSMFRGRGGGGHWGFVGHGKNLSNSGITISASNEVGIAKSIYKM